MKALAGFREFYPEEAARRQAILTAWREVAGRYGFAEFDGPTLEPLDLYAKKNAGGEEILGQLYRFTDGGGREVALRPEMTPTLARMAAAREKHYRKPMKWFSIGNFFRFERQQRGRLREFLQLNCDILGETGEAADAELVALVIDLMRAFGFSARDFVVRLSHRGAWTVFLESRGLRGEAIGQVLQIADKLERESAETLEARLAPFGLTLDDLRTFLEGPPPEALHAVLEDLKARGFGEFLKVDLSIVRGLAYYTGLVFEVFDRSRAFRALAGGGRYNDLIGGLGGGAPLPAVGFGMGDVVLGKFIEATPHAAENLRARVARSRKCDACIVVADESHRPDALRLLQELRDAGLSVEMGFQPAKVGRQFQAAEAAGATHAIVVGTEWPVLKVKHLATRQEVGLPYKEGELADWLKKTHA